MEDMNEGRVPYALDVIEKAWNTLQLQKSTATEQELADIKDKQSQLDLAAHCIYMEVH